MIETLGATGIRISELPFITVEAVMQGRATVSLKGKTRIVLLPMELRRKLRASAGQKKISTGSLFVTRSGRQMDRSNVLHAMKKLALEAGVAPEKVYPHNLRHLFACTYYRKKKTCPIWRTCWDIPILIQHESTHVSVEKHRR